MSDTCASLSMAGRSLPQRPSDGEPWAAGKGSAAGAAQREDSGVRQYARAREIAGVAENQRYGLGTNSLTGGQKSGLIYGALAAFFALFIAGYFMD